MKGNVFLVTGGTGFIGSILVRRLVANGERVHLLARKQANFWRIKDLLGKVKCHRSDLTDVDSLKRILEKVSPNVVYHLATYGAYSYQKNADQIIRTNILGTWNLLQALSGVDYNLLVNTESASDYGSRHFQVLATDPLDSASYYAATKCSQTLL